MNSISPLLAKRPTSIEAVMRYETLIGHTESVMESADYLTGLLAEPLSEISMSTHEEIECWRKAVIISAWLHDSGKANDHFQRMIFNPSFIQGVRHETISLFIADELELTALWYTLPIWAKFGALFSICGHHLKFPDPITERPGTHVTILFDHPDFQAWLEIGKEKFGCDAHLPIGNQKLSLLGNGQLRQRLKDIRRRLDHDFTQKEKVLIASIKTTLLSADLAGSALPRALHDPIQWLEQRLSKVLKYEQLSKIVESKLHGRRPKEFQFEVQDSNEDTVVLEAGCGSGKTAAAYLWAARKAEGKRLFFCYPTTGTASEGFAGYLQDPDFDALLIHSRAHVDYKLLENMPDINHEESFLSSARLEALETWPIPAVVCTAHTVLGILENVRRGLFAWPSIARSVYVFDEIHSYSDRLFSYLLRFLKTFPNACVLLMTATLPPSRKRALQELCGRERRVKFIKGPEIREKSKRYALERTKIDKAWDFVNRGIAEGKKILWVCNTVRRAQEFFDEARARGLRPKLFHSRFKYKDRLKHQREVIDSFRPKIPAMLAVTTQVAEMSLDISADILITEISPIPSIIQRLGRLNRFSDQPDLVCPAYLINPKSRLPYDDEQLFGVEEWLENVCDGSPKCQFDLAQAFIEITESQECQIGPAPRCEWLDGLWATQKNKRSIEEAGLSISVIMETDSEADVPATCAIPMPFPRGDAWKAWPRRGMFLVAPEHSISYDNIRGASWNTV